MDPQVTWDQMLRAVACQDWDEVRELATALSEWIARGGFPPKVIVDPAVGDPFNAALAASACEFALGEACNQGWPP
jgi:hypothetical protein